MFSVLKNAMRKQELKNATFGQEQAEIARSFHRGVPGYAPTELVELKALAKRLGVKSIYVKDEASRFGLKAFKGLGGSYAMFRILCARLKLEPQSVSFADFSRPEIREACRGLEFVTATDGNHGKGVAWAASLFGCRAHVLLPKGSVEARRLAIEQAGNAEAVITELNYDDTVAYAGELAEKNKWILLQDTAWDGYEQIPAWIIEGYLTLAAEAAEQLGENIPTHIFLQAGVGAMAGGVMDYMLRHYADKPPVVNIVEPEEAACIYASVEKGDGKAYALEGDPVTIMAGLNCGTPCQITWPIMRDHADFFWKCDDEIARLGMRLYAKAEEGDKPIVSGESGAVTLGLLTKLLQYEQHKRLLGLNSDSIVLLLNTEGDTDPENYQAIVG